MSRIILLIAFCSAGCTDRVILNQGANIEIHLVTHRLFQYERPGSVGCGAYRPGRITLAPGICPRLLASLLMHEFCHVLDDHQGESHWRVLEEFIADNFNPTTHGIP